MTDKKEKKKKNLQIFRTPLELSHVSIRWRARRQFLERGSSNWNLMGEPPVYYIQAGQSKLFLQVQPAQVLLLVQWRTLATCHCLMSSQYALWHLTELLPKPFVSKVKACPLTKAFSDGFCYYFNGKMPSSCQKNCPYCSIHAATRLEDTSCFPCHLLLEP